MGGGSKQSNDFLAAAVGMLSNAGAAASVQPADRATVSESAIYSLYSANNATYNAAYNVAYNATNNAAFQH